MHRDVHAIRVSVGAVWLACVLAANVAAQQPSTKPAPPPVNGAAHPPPNDYIIGANDVLTITLFGQDPKYSGDVTVRPDGKITMILIDEIVASGRTPLQLKAELTKAYSKYFQEPVIIVNPRQINSRMVYISGQVFKPGAYPLNDSMDILQLIALAGGLQEYADKENIVLIRKELLPNGSTKREFFNYKKVFQKGATITIPQLKPGDQVFVN
jgi:polysaccharide export outer membrane protein